MSTLAERAIEARLSIEEYAENRSEFARAIGISASAVFQIEEGRTKELKGETLVNYVRVTGYSANWLLTGRGPKMNAEKANKPLLRPIFIWNDPSDLPPDDYVLLRKFDVLLSAGHGGPCAEADPEDMDLAVPFPADYAAKRGWRQDTHYIFRCSGESMEPTIQDGAPVVLAVNQTTVISGKVYALKLEPDAQPLLKRLDRLPGGRFRVRSDNPAPQFAAFEVSEDEIEILGRADWTEVEL